MCKKALVDIHTKNDDWAWELEAAFFFLINMQKWRTQQNANRLYRQKENEMKENHE